MYKETGYGMKTTGMSLMIIVTLSLWLSGCLNKYTMSEQVTSYNTGCAAEDVQVFDEVDNLNSDHTWTAKCGGKTYLCSDHSSAGSVCYEVTE